MPYVVLARRWRPLLFGDVVGQEHVTKTLQNAISANRIAHAYLFSGPRGVGKTTVARILAKAVNCSEGPRPEPCEECSTCKQISAGRSMDVIEIDAASNRGIDEIRELRESVKFAPVSGRYKVYIIDEAHMLTIEAFNALLKTLEEPPAHVIFILATTEPHKIPATILSRCQRFDFRMLTRSEIIERLRELAKADSISFDDEALSLIAESADGGMRDAESILDQLLSFGGGEIRTEEVGKLLGLGAYKVLDQLVGNILKKDAAASLQSLKDLADYGADLSQCLKKLVSYFRDLMVYKINPDLIDAPETRMSQLAKQSGGVSIERLMKIARILAQTESEIKQLGYERLNMELALVKLSRLTDDTIPMDEVLGRLEEIGSQISSGNVKLKAVEKAPEPVYDEANVSVADQEAEAVEEESDPLKAKWSEFLGTMRKKDPMRHALLKEASLLSIGDDCVTIDFDARFKWHREQVREPGNQKAIEAELSALMDRPMKLKLKETDPSKENGNPEQEAPVSDRDMRIDAGEDESVKLLLDVFNGRVVDVKK